MPIISDTDRDRLKREFRKDLKSEVTIRLFSQGSSLLTVPGRDCKYCPQTQELMDELAALSPKLHLEVYDFYGDAEARDKYGVERIPAIVLGKNGVDGLKFYGIPLGYEFAAIIEDIKTLSRGVSPLTMDSRKKLRKVNQPVHIQVFVTPTCGYCPAMARLAHAVAIESPQITADVIEVEEFPALAQMYAVRGVPKTVMGTISPLAGAASQVQITGVVPEAQFVEKVLEAGVKEVSQDTPTQPAR